MFQLSRNRANSYAEKREADTKKALVTEGATPLYNPNTPRDKYISLATETVLLLRKPSLCQDRP